VKCPWCVARGERSTLTPTMCFVTAMMGRSFYDEEGEWHVHDPNGDGRAFVCSNGHEFYAGDRGCPACGEGASPPHLTGVVCQGSLTEVPWEAEGPEECPACGQSVPLIHTYALGPEVHGFATHVPGKACIQHHSLSWWDIRKRIKEADQMEAALAEDARMAREFAAGREPHSVARGQGNNDGDK
jgi:hypothetical protein